MPIVVWILFGLLVGIAAKFAMSGRDVTGFLVMAVLGIVGAVAGGLLGRMIGWDGNGTSAEVVVAVIGSIAPLVAYRLWLGDPARA